LIRKYNRHHGHCWARQKWHPALPPLVGPPQPQAGRVATDKHRWTRMRGGAPGRGSARDILRKPRPPRRLV